MIRVNAGLSCNAGEGGLGLFGQRDGASVFIDAQRRVRAGRGAGGCPGKPVDLSFGLQYIHLDRHAGGG
jgi:hypothetical protein